MSTALSHSTADATAPTERECGARLRHSTADATAPTERECGACLSHSKADAMAPTGRLGPLTRGSQGPRPTLVAVSNCSRETGLANAKPYVFSLHS